MNKFIGISSSYDIPDNPEITFLTGEHIVGVCARQIIEYLESNGKIDKVTIA